MNSDSPTRILLWLLALILAVASLVGSYVELAGLPDLGLVLGPDLTVRSVDVDRSRDAERKEFKRGDRLVAIQGRSVEDLRDLRTIVRNLPDDLSEPAAPAAAGEAVAEQAEPTIAYQLVRPLHRFTIVLQGENIDPTSLPAGVEPTDRLVMLDGRPLPNKVGPEAVRSIMSSRPEAAMVFERTDAVFKGRMPITEARPPIAAMIAFGAAILIVLALWLFRDRELHPMAAAAVAFETVCIAWIGLVAFEYQWVLASLGLGAAGMAAFGLIRPFALFGRALAGDSEDISGLLAVVLGVFATGTVMALFFGGKLDNAEVALQAASLIAGLFVVYELFQAGLEGGARTTLGEGRGYLAWIVVLGFFATLVYWYLEPVAFEEGRWRWFAGVLLSLVWIGDVLFCLRGTTTQSYAELAHADDRQRLLRDFFAQVELEIPDERIALVVWTPSSAVELRLGREGVDLHPASDRLHDAIAILIQEGVRVPLPDNINLQAHPMGGIAKAMHIALAMPLRAPAGAIAVPQVEVVVVGTDEAIAGEIPPHPNVDTLDVLEAMVDQSVFTAALVEGLAELALQARLATEAGAELDERAEEGEAAPSPEVVELEKTIAQLEAELSQARADAEQASEQAADEAVEAEPAVTAAAVVEAFPVEVQPDPPEVFRGLVEPELVDALEYLLSEPEPIMLAGSPGAGKTFVARCANRLEGRAKMALFGFDAAEHSQADVDRLLFGDPDASVPARRAGLLAACADASVLITAAQTLADAVVLRLCEASETLGVRLYLAFDADDAQERSIVDGRAAELGELLGHRELIVPDLARRRAVLPRILEYYLHIAATRHQRDVTGFSETALDALLAYDWPGHVDEAIVQVDLAVKRAMDDQVKFDDLGLDIRSS